MNLLGRTAKVINWILFGNGRSLLSVADKLVESAEINIGKDGLTIKFKKEF